MEISDRDLADLKPEELWCWKGPIVCLFSLQSVVSVTIRAISVVPESRFRNQSVSNMILAFK